MTAFDAELYLRLAAERELPADVHHAPTPTAVAAGALVAAGLIEESAAAGLLREYASARALRARDVHSWFWHAQGFEEDPGEPQPFEARRAFLVGEEIAHPQGRLRVDSVSFGTETTVLTGELKADAMSWHAPPGLTLADDSGTREAAEFDGHGWDEDGLSGRFTTSGPLSAETAWVEVDGRRVALGQEIPPHEVRVEALPERDPALRFLWQLAAPDVYGHGEVSIEPALDALVAAGVLAADHPELDAVRAVVAMWTGPGHSPLPLPEPYRSLRRGGHGHGPEGSLVVNAVTPVFDGFAIAVDALQSNRHGWSLTVRVAPGDRGSPFDGGSMLPTRRVRWWAADDRGHSFLGHVGNWSGFEDHGTGSVEFEGALDPKASRLELQPTVSEHRAVISVPLEWA